MADPVDLRSDTVTTPTDAMRAAMAAAEVGDDCYGEDPTVNRLQEMAAELIGTEAALFVPTGTMANQIAVKVLSEPGAEVICERDCHLIHHESGACAHLSQVQLRGLASDGGVLSPDAIARAVRPPDPYQPRSALVAVENTHNAAGGTAWRLDAFSAAAAAARAAELPFFCDGARLFNACVALGVEARSYGELCDVITLSLYKGLAAPMGSLVCGTAETIERAWRYRRIFGGALRQAGVVAAAGIVALETMMDQLAVDNANAARLASGFAEVTPDAVTEPDTNMVVVDTERAGGDVRTLIGALKADGVLCGPMSATTVRFVTHKDVDEAGVDRAIAAFARAVSGSD